MIDFQKIAQDGIDAANGPGDPPPTHGVLT